jgi:molecular chaperone GrpE
MIDFIRAFNLNLYMSDEKEFEQFEERETEEVIDDLDFEELDWVGDEKKDKEKLKELRLKLKESQSESREHLTALQRSRADYVNLKKEKDQVSDVVKQKTTERIILDMLPILDSFDMAMGNTDAWNAVDQNWRVGVEYIYNQVKTALEDYSVSEISKTNVVFDPTIHEPMGTLETEDEKLDDVIEKVIQKGYKIGDKILRPAKVIVWNYKK